MKIREFQRNAAKRKSDKVRMQFNKLLSIRAMVIHLRNVTIIILLQSLLMSCSSSTEVELERLYRAFWGGLKNSGLTTLVITIKGTDDFLQFSRDGKDVEMTFPLITDRQRSLEEKFRNACLTLNLEPIIVEGSDGSKFFDVELPRSPDEQVEITVTLFKDIFGANKRTLVVYELY